MKNIRINIDQKTGRFMGSVLVYFDDRAKVSKILETIQANPLSQQFRVLAVNSEEADRIISTFMSKEVQ